jgi:hypothetical protein
VIAKYDRWLADQHHLLRALDELSGRDLVCFCAPRRSAAAARECHARRARRVVARREGGGVKRVRGRPGRV